MIRKLWAWLTGRAVGRAAQPGAGPRSKANSLFAIAEDAEAEVNALVDRYRSSRHAA